MIDPTINITDIALCVGVAFAIFKRYQDVPELQKEMEAMREAMNELSTSLAALTASFDMYQRLKNGGSRLPL